MVFKNTKIITIIIPESVTQIGRKCFEDCDQLREITCPARLKDSIAENFPSDKITSIPLPDGGTH